MSSENYNYIEKIKNCKNYNEIYQVLKDINFPSTNNKFSSNYIELPLSTKQLNKSYFKGSFELQISVKLLLFFKLKGLLGKKPNRSGKRNTLLAISRIMTFLFQEYNIQYLTDITSIMISQYIEANKDKSSEYLLSHLKIIDLLIHKGNRLLPSFFYIRKSILYHNSKWIKLKQQAFSEKKQSIIGNKRNPFSINTLIKIMHSSIKYIDTYNKDLILLLNKLAEIDHFNREIKNYQLFKLFKSTPYTFKEPCLFKIQEEIKKKDSFSKTPIRTFKTCIKVIDYFQTACSILIYSYTGMRSSELINLNKNPEIQQLEYFSLKRMITKTAGDKDYEEDFIPIPDYAVKLLNYLSLISEKKDINNCKNIIIGSFYYKDKRKQLTTQSMEKNIRLFCQYLGFEDTPTTHQLRHCLAFLFFEFNKNKDSLILLKKLYGHKSITMILQYFTHVHSNFKEILNKNNIGESKILSKKIIKELEEGKKIFGNNLENIFNYNNMFKGSYIESFKDLFEETFLTLINQNQIQIIQTPYCLCIHNINDKNKFECQHNLNQLQENTTLVFPAKCESIKCKHSVFFEMDIENIQLKDIDEELKNRLLQNMYFVESGGFDNVESYSNLPYFNYKEGLINGQTK